MNKLEFMKFILESEINLDRVNQIEDIYKAQLPELLAKIVSVAGQVTFFDEERRALSFEGIIYASEDIGVDFVDKGMIPIIDAYDLNYIVYMVKEQKWAVFNVADDDIFEEDVLLENIL